MSRRNTLDDYWRQVSKSEPDKCWPWTGGTISSGYGAIKLNQVNWLVHKLAWTLLKGPIEKGLWLYNDCGCKLCCNPAHMHVGQPEENITRDMNTVDDFWKFVEKKGDDDCWEWLGCIKPNGYGQINYCGKNWNAQRLSWYLHFGEIRRGRYVCHHCDNKRCVNPKHLFVGTAQDNMDDCIRKGRKATILTEEQVKSIREDYDLGRFTQAELASKFAISSGNISRIVNRKIWRYCASPTTVI